MESVSVHGNNGGGSGGLVVTELSQIKELVRQLQGHLGGSPELCRHLAAQISSVTERSISLIKRSAGDAAAAAAAAAHSPLSDASGGAPFKTAKKRKTSEKKRHQVRVSSAGGGGDNPVDDGHSWRKYGQKEILGAKHPRGYYRCTHRHSKGCAATKQVQRADEDPALIDVVYLGEHTCCVKRAAVAGQAATTGAEAPEHNSSPLPSPSSGLAVKVEGLAVEPETLKAWGGANTTPIYLLSTPPASGGCLAEERGPLSVPSTSENWDVCVSPATSDSNHVVPFPAFEAAGDDLRFGFEEVVSAFDECGDGLDIDISSFFA